MVNVHPEYWDRPLEGADDTNHIPRTMAHFLSGVLRFLCKLVFRFRVENREVAFGLIEQGSSAVLVSPHTSYLDVVFMFLCLRPRGWVRMMARDSLFEAGGGVAGNVFSHVGAFPVKRNVADRTSLKRAAHMLKNGEWVGIYPEGTRRGKGSEVPQLHGGAALVARMGKAPIVPMGMENVGDIKRKGERLRLPRITARFGTPVEVGDFDFLPKDERLDGCTWYVMREAFALSRNCAPEEVDMCALFPDAKDYAATFAVHPIGLHQ